MTTIHSARICTAAQIGTKESLRTLQSPSREEICKALVLAANATEHDPLHLVLFAPSGAYAYLPMIREVVLDELVGDMNINEAITHLGESIRQEELLHRTYTTEP